MLFAIMGTVVSVLVVAGLTLLTSEYHGITSVRVAFAYASLISSVDPVATLSTFGRLNVDPLLFILVFGESQINDAVAITLFDALNESGIKDPGGLVLRMIGLLFGSIGIGLGLAAAYLLVFRFTKMGQCPSQAIMFIFVSSFFTYSFAESLKFSGIITVLFNSILMGSFVPAHMSTEGAAMTSFLLKQMASLMDTSIFILCGVNVVFVFMDGGDGIRFGLMVSAFCLVGRFCAIVPLGLISNGVKAIVGRRLPAERRHQISCKHLFMMWHSGLRGGVSLVLAMELGAWVDAGEGEGKGTKVKLVNATFVVIVLYLAVFGGTTGVCLRCLGLPVGDQVPEGKELYDAEDKHGWGWRSFVYIRKKFLVPLLVGGDVMPVAGKTWDGVLNEASKAEQSADFGRDYDPNHLRRHQSAHCARGLHDVFDLFGTTDPAHVEAIEDIMRDLRAEHADMVLGEDEEEDSEGSGLSSCGDSDGDMRI